MKKSTINLTIELDEQNIPEKILWDATDKPGHAPSETKAIGLSIWDNESKETLRIDLYGKETPVDVMKIMTIDTIAAMSQNILKSTGDEKMAAEMNAFCENLVKYIGK
jgi:gliding motility-associated protein GldC